MRTAEQVACEWQDHDYPDNFNRTLQLAVDDAYREAIHAAECAVNGLFTTVTKWPNQHHMNGVFDGLRQAHEAVSRLAAEANR